MPNRTTFVGKLLKEYKGHLDLVPEVVRHLPIYTDYNVRLDAINAGLAQELRPREFLRFLLVDDLKIQNDVDRQFAIHKLERALHYQRGSFRVRMLSPRDLGADISPPLQKTLSQLTGQKDFWHRTSFSSSEADNITFYNSITQASDQELAADTRRPEPHTR